MYFVDFTDTADYWNFPFESPAFNLELEDTWEVIRPLYELLHAYVRRRLRDYYGPEKINRQAPLPAHILGNMWAQSWTNIYDITQPYPGKNMVDVTPEMIKQVSGFCNVANEQKEFFSFSLFNRKSEIHYVLHKPSNLYRINNKYILRVCE